MADQPEQPKSREVRVRVNDEQKYGIYANFLVVSHSAHEFTLDFCQTIPSSGGEVQADVVSRVKIAPTLLGTVLEALSKNMDIYERQHGQIRRMG